MKTNRMLRRTSCQIFTACGGWLIGLGLYFVFLRPPFLPEDLRYIGFTTIDTQFTMPRLELWLRHVFRVMGGFITGCGLLTILVAIKMYSVQEKLTWMVLSLVGLFTVGTMSLINIQINSDFKWLLMIPSLLWITGLVLAVFQRVKG